MGERKSRRDRGRSILYSLSTIVLIFARSQRSDTPHPPSFLYSLLLISFQINLLLLSSFFPFFSQSSPLLLLLLIIQLLLLHLFSFSLSPLPHLFPLILFILSPPSLTLPSSHQKTNSNSPVIGRFFQVRGNEIGGERDGWWEREGG